MQNRKMKDRSDGPTSRGGQEAPLPRTRRDQRVRRAYSWCIFSERSLYVIGRPSVCLSVTFVHPTQGIEIFGNVMFLHHLVRWPSADIQVKFYGDRRSKSSKVTEFGTNRKLICDFLLVINTNLAPISCTVSEI